MLTPPGFYKPVEGVIRIRTDRQHLFIVVEDSLQSNILDAHDIADRVIGIAQVLHDCRLGEEL